MSKRKLNRNEEQKKKRIMYRRDEGKIEADPYCYLMASAKCRQRVPM